MPLKTANKRAQITDLLRESILCGQLPPGTRLPEMRLARELGVSQAIVREALQELESLGLIAKTPGQGASVIELTADDLTRIYDVRSALESLACAFAARVLTPENAAALEACLADMRAAADRDDFMAYSRADVQFHRRLWAAQPNRYLERSLEALCLALFAYDQIRRAATTAMDYARVTRQHELILSALRTGDGDRVARLMRRLMRGWLRVHLAEYARVSPISPDPDARTADAFALLREQARRLFAEK